MKTHSIIDDTSQINILWCIAVFIHPSWIASDDLICVYLRVVQIVQQRVPLSSQQIHFSEHPGLFVVRLDSCIQDGSGCKLHSTRPGAAGSSFQLQHCHIVGCSGAEDAGRNKKRHLRASSRPVTSQIEAVNPNLPLKMINLQMQISGFQ